MIELAEEGIAGVDLADMRYLEKSHHVGIRPSSKPGDLKTSEASRCGQHISAQTPETKGHAANVA